MNGKEWEKSREMISFVKIKRDDKLSVNNFSLKI